MSRTEAEELVGTLAQAAVQRIYGLVGDSLNPVIDALLRSGKVEWLHVRHEETAAFAAGAEAQLTGRLAMVQLEMEVAGMSPFGCNLKNPNFAALAQSIGLFGVRVEDPAEVRPALARALEHKGPALVEVVTDPNALAMPPRATIKQAAGFALAMTKVAFGGQVNDVLDTVAASWRELA
jgi:thiamine pyrophosphate-dependent acetolactate synthase large subunit-like protein